MVKERNRTTLTVAGRRDRRGRDGRDGNGELHEKQGRVKS